MVFLGFATIRVRSDLAKAVSNKIVLNWFYLELGLLCNYPFAPIQSSKWK